MPTFKEQLEKMTGLQHRLAVWEALHAYVEENFLSKDGAKAKKALRAPGCLVEVVPETIIEDVVQFLGENHIEEIRGEIARLEGMDVSSSDTQGEENN